MEIATEAFILLRAINARLYDKYLAFFIYLSAVLLIDLLRVCVLTLHPNVYAPLYWYTQFLHAGIGYAVILEIYRQTLNNSPGVSCIARTFLWGCTLWSYSPNPAAETESKIDRDYKLIAEQTRRALSRARSFFKMGGEL